MSPARQGRSAGHVYAIVDEVDSILIDEARTPLIISGRVADAAKLYYKFATHRPRPAAATTTTRSTRRSARSRPPRTASRRSSRRSASRTSTTASPRTSSTSSRPRCKAKELFKRDKDYIIQQRRGEDRRRVHRPHPRGPALVRGPPPGGRGQGGREDQGGEPDPRHDHPPELLPHVRQARRHDRHGRQPRRPSSPAPTTSRSCRSPPTGRLVRVDEADLIYKTEDAKFERRGRRHRRALRDRPAGARRHDLGREVREALAGCSRSGASPTRCSTPSSTPGRPRSSPRPAGSTRSPWPPTWPVAASTSSSAATPRAWPSATSRAEGLDLETDEGQARYDELLARSTRPRCKAEGDKVRELGGLYVLGTERHERRRIDNQLRGRSGRQGDPGESRFYLSLEDDLMRLFATGAMNWVMGKALPDDVPHRGEDGHQGHRAGADHRRAAQRRDPQERPQVRRGDERAAQGDLHAPRPDPRRGRPPRGGARVPRRGRRRRSIGTYCVADFDEEWDLDGLARRGRARTGRPTLTVEQLARRQQHRRALRAAHGRGHRATTRSARAELGADDRCARSSAR